MIDLKKKPILVFIGTMKHHVDCIAPSVGKLLEKEDLGYEIIYCDQTQIKEVASKCNDINKEENQIIAFDVGFLDSTSKFQTLEHGIKPAELILGDEVPEIGDLGIVINIKDIYKGSMKNQKKQFLSNKENEKIHKRVDRKIIDTYIALKKLLRLYEER